MTEDYIKKLYELYMEHAHRSASEEVEIPAEVIEQQIRQE